MKLFIMTFVVQFLRLSTSRISKYICFNIEKEIQRNVHRFSLYLQPRGRSHLLCFNSELSAFFIQKETILIQIR
jgi:hypothetical protein